MIENNVAQIQTKAAVMSAEFSQYSSLRESEKDGIYNRLVQYSELNSVRIRVVNVNFVIVSDSYSMETGKTLLNSKALSSYNTGKSLSGYDKNTGTIEAAVPIYNGTGQMMGVFLMDMDISEITSLESTVMDKTSTVAVALLTIMMALAIAISKTYGNSFKKAFRTVEEIANGHVDKRIKVKGYTELQHFAVDFNTIMDKASTTDQSRQEFVSNVSHELKTPLTSIKVLADSLNMQEDAPIELYQEFMHDIAEEIDRESKIIEDLLSLVRLDKSASTINISSVNLNELLEIVLKRLKPIAQKKNVEVLFESFRPVVAEIDEVKFTQVISNLVENAIKYNKIDGWVHVSLNADYQYFYVRVEDSGIGIPKENQDMVFERFYRVDKARSRETGGTGLGLAIVKNIIILHHGTVKLHSEEGSGTTFTVRIPLNYVEQGV
jgi:signal transduction histidine kinase